MLETWQGKSEMTLTLLIFGLSIGGANLLAPAADHSIDEGSTMLFTDMIIPPDQGEQPMLLVQTDSQIAEVDNTIWFVGDVQDVGNYDPRAGELGQGRVFGPQDLVDSLLGSSGWLRRQGIASKNPKISVNIETMPKHGRMEYIESGEFSGWSRYTPDAGFLGRDFVSFIVTVENKRIRVNMGLEVKSYIPLHPEEDGFEDAPEEGCELHSQKFAAVISNDGARVGWVAA
jgi:hypothetical protein